MNKNKINDYEKKRKNMRVKWWSVFEKHIMKYGKMQIMYRSTGKLSVRVA